MAEVEQQQIRCVTVPRWKSGVTDREYASRTEAYQDTAREMLKRLVDEESTSLPIFTSEHMRELTRIIFDNSPHVRYILKVYDEQVEL